MTPADRLSAELAVTDSDGEPTTAEQVRMQALLAERDRLAVALRSEQARVQSLIEIRNQLQRLRGEERAEREALAAQVQRVRDLIRGTDRVVVAAILRALDGGERS